MAKKDTSREIAQDVAHTLTLPGLDLVLIQVEVEVPAEKADITEDQAAEEMTEEVAVTTDAEEVQVIAAETQEAQAIVAETAEEEGADQEV